MASICSCHTAGANAGVCALPRFDKIPNAIKAAIPWPLGGSSQTRVSP